MILGIDISTTVCGWCLLHDDGSAGQYGWITFNKNDDLYDRLNVFLTAMKEVVGDKTQVYVEEAAKMFGSASTAHVMSLLQRWNGMVCSAINVEFGIKPVLLSALRARKLVGISLPRKTNRKQTKNLIVQHIRSCNLLPESTWHYKKTGSLKDYCFDIADAYVIARAGWLSSTFPVS